MKNGVKFGDKHSIDDWDLLMTYKEIEAPKPKIIEIEIPGSDGVKDLSEAFGEIKYDNRNIITTFDLFQNYTEWNELRQEIATHLHGKKQKIIFN